jgi:hypothetical protein
MKGYRKLREGARIKKGDVFEDYITSLTLETSSQNYGEKHDLDVHMQHYRQIKNTRPKRLDLDGKLTDIGLNLTQRVAVKYLIQDNYRRRVK